MTWSLHAMEDAARTIEHGTCLSNNANNVCSLSFCSHLQVMFAILLNYHFLPLHMSDIAWRLLQICLDRCMNSSQLMHVLALYMTIQSCHWQCACYSRNPTLLLGMVQLA